MIRYKNWMAIILTMILVVTGTTSPVLAVELVSAAALSDDNELDVAAAPEITEIEEHEDMAEIPAGEADVPAGEAVVPTGEADVPTGEAVVSTGEADVPTDAVTPADDLDMHDDAAIPTAPDITAEQPDEADTVSAPPRIPGQEHDFVQ